MPNRKTIPLNKNVRVTVSKNGPSISFGKPGARVLVNKNGVRGSVGIPGSGVYFRKSKSFPKDSKVKKLAVILSTLAMFVIILYFILCYTTR